MTDLQIDFIREFGDKELNQWCILQIYWNTDLWFIQEKYSEESKYRWFEIWFHTLQQNVYLTDTEILARKDIEILWHEPHLFPDVAKKLKEKGYNLEVLKVDALTSVIRISRWDIKKPQFIEYKPCLPLLEQPSAMESLLSLIK